MAATVVGVIRSTFVTDEDGKIVVAQYNAVTGHVAASARPVGIAASRLAAALHGRRAFQHSRCRLSLTLCAHNSGVFYPGDKAMVACGGEPSATNRDRPAHHRSDRHPHGLPAETPTAPHHRQAARLDGVGPSGLAARDSDSCPRGVLPRWASTVQVRRGTLPGATRILIRPARGISVLTLPQRMWCRCRLRWIAGFAQSCCGTEPVPISDTRPADPTSAYLVQPVIHTRRGALCMPATAALLPPSCRLANSCISTGRAL